MLLRSWKKKRGVTPKPAGIWGACKGTPAGGAFPIGASGHFANSDPSGQAGKAAGLQAGKEAGTEGRPRRGCASPEPRPPGRAEPREHQPSEPGPSRAARPAARSRAGSMANAAEPPGRAVRAAGYLQELTQIVSAQQELLARRRRRIEELELQVARLSLENAGLLERHRRHLAGCPRRPDPCPTPLSSIPELGGGRLDLDK